MTCRRCGELFVHMQACRFHEQFCFCASIRPEAEGLFIGFAIAMSKFGHLPPPLTGLGKLLNTSDIFTTRTVGWWG